MISTKDFSQLEKPGALQVHCKAIAALDAIFSPNWEDRYHTYNSEWDTNEEIFEMQNSEGDHVLILFRPDGCVMNGYSVESTPKNKEELLENLPEIFDEFMYDEPINSIGTSFCLWMTNDDVEWQKGYITDFNDGSEHILSILSGQVDTYIAWASEYFEDCYKGTEINKEAVTRIFNGETLTKELVLTLIDSMDSWEQFSMDLDEIGYPYSFGK